jgi:FkbM family methyltransferase
VRGGVPSVRDVVEAWRLGDRVVDRARLVSALTAERLSRWIPVARRWPHDISFRSHGLTLFIDVRAREQRPVREVLARDEYGLLANPAPRGGVVIDVGANVGVLTVLAASQVGSTGRVLAFEPHPQAYRRLLKAIRANRFEDRVTAYNVAVSDRRGRVQVVSGVATVEAQIAETATGGTIAVPLDEVEELASHAVIDLLKIDVEGHESKVLLGASQALNRIARVTLEYHSPDRRAECIAILRGAGLALTAEHQYDDSSGLITATQSVDRRDAPQI